MSESSVRMCDEMRIVLPMERSSLSRARNSMRALGSSPFAGSSRIRTFGSWHQGELGKFLRCFLFIQRELRHVHLLINNETEI